MLWQILKNNIFIFICRIIDEKIIEEAVALYEEILNIEDCRWSLDHMNIKEYFWHMVNTKSSQLEDDWEISEVSNFKSCMKSFELAFSGKHFI